MSLRLIVRPAVIIGILFLAGCDKSYLTVSHLVVTENQIIVRLHNQGGADVPSGKGKLQVFVDGTLQREIPLVSLPRQAFLKAGESTNAPTDVRISGTGRRVSVLLDPDREIVDQNYFQRTCSRILNATPASGPRAFG